MIVGIITGGFDPVHSGHINYIKAAKENCDVLVVGVNSDDWLVRKKGRFFMPYSERSKILISMEGINLVVPFNDDDNSAFGAIEVAHRMFPEATLVFMNGGDRTQTNIPEMSKALDSGIDCMFVFGIGGNDKANSSSWILSEWAEPKTVTRWGYYRQLAKGNKFMTKELVVDPGKTLSDQKHFGRSEEWHLVEGELHMDVEKDGKKETIVLTPGNSYHVDVQEWHRAYNQGSVPAKAIETWHGELLSEDDIERRNFNG